MKKYKVKNNRFFHLSIILVIFISFIFLVISPNYQTAIQKSQINIHESSVLSIKDYNVKTNNDLKSNNRGFSPNFADPDFLYPSFDPYHKGVIPAASRSLDDICSALIDGADYLRFAQSDITEDNAVNGDPDIDPEDGGWDWVLTSPVFNHSSSSSPKNIYGATAQGLFYAYLKTGNSTYKIALDDAANYMISDANIRSAADLIFLMLYDDLPSVTNTTYQDAAKVKYDGRITTYGNATAFAEYIRDVRYSQGYGNGIIAWDIGAWARAAAMLHDRYPGNGYDTDSDDIAEVIWQDSFNGTPGYFNISSDNGWDPNYTNVDYWWYTLGITGLIDAFNFADVHSSDITTLTSILLNCQYPSGAFSFSYGANIGDEDWQSTAYTVLSLAMLDQDFYQSNINDAGSWIASTQDVSGGWVYGGGNHYPEIGGENTAALYFGGLIKNIDTGETFCNIQSAIDDSDTINGHTILVSEGSFLGARIYKDIIIQGSTSGSSIIYDGVHYGGGHPSLTTAFHLDIGSDGVEIRNFTINCNMSNNFYFGVFSRGIDNVVVDSLIINDAVQGITNWGGSNWVITNNNLTDTVAAGGGGIGIFLGATPPSYRSLNNNLVQYNRISADGTEIGYTSPGICLCLDVRWSYGDLNGSETVTNNQIVDNWIKGTGNTNEVGIEAGVIGVSGDPIKINYTMGMVHDNYIINNEVNGSDYGIYAYVVENLTIENNYIYNCSSYGISLWDDFTGNINYNNLVGNTFGLFNNISTSMIDATCNWWGDVSGPSGVGSGTGDAVGNYTKYRLWLDDEYPYGDCIGGAVCLNIDTGEYFCSIQSAIDDADTLDGHTIEVFTGIIIEQVEIWKDLTIYGQGVGNTTIMSPDILLDYFTTNSNNYPIIYVHDVDNVLIHNLTIDGADKGNSNYRFVGIGIYRSSVILTDLEVINVRDNPLSGTQHGVGIYGWSDATGTSHNIVIDDCIVYNFQKTGIVIGGSDISVDIGFCNVTGVGPTSVTAQNGIQVGYGSTGSIHDNTVSACSYTGPSWAASGILPIFSGGTLDISNNNIQENQVNIYLASCSADVTENNIYATSVGTGVTYFYGVIGDPGNPDVIPDPSPFKEDSFIESSFVSYNFDVIGNKIISDGSPGGIGVGVYAGMYGTYDIDFSASENDVKYWEYGFELYEYEPNNLITADINYNNIVGNTVYGIYNWLNDTFDATCNWWGDISGPSGVGPGTGDAISDYLVYYFWLDDEYPYGNCSGGAAALNINQGVYYRCIQCAIDNSTNGDTIYVFNGIYYEKILINKSISLIGEDKNITIIDGNLSGNVINVTASNVNISGFTIQNGDDNGLLVNSNSNNISDNIIQNNIIGLNLFYSDENIIIKNDFLNNNNGIYVKSSNNNTLDGNSFISNNFKGIWLSSAKKTLINNCNISTNKDGLYVDSSPESIILNNTVINNNETGVYISASDNCSISNNYLRNNEYSVFLDHYSEYCNIENNTVEFNDFRGVFLKYTSYTSVKNNDIQNNQAGVGVYYSNNNEVLFNNLSSNEFGVRIKNSIDNLFKYNSLDSNEVGFYIYETSMNNYIIGNSLKQNVYYSIQIEELLYPSTHNIIYHNNFYNLSGIDNTSDECSNTWNNNTDNYFGGNYWSNYDEPGEGAWDNDSNYIVDSPYNISDGSNSDLYPLLYEWTQIPPSANFTWTPLNPTTSDVIDFIDLSSDTLYGTILGWYWEFGDGFNITKVQNPSHKYDDDGVYMVNLTVLDNDDAMHTISLNITVLNVAPVANFSWVPLFPSTSDFVNFTDLSYDTDGSVVNWSWDFGDGNSSFDQNPIHSYGNDGVYTVTLVIVDDDGASSNLSDFISVGNTPPVANFSWVPLFPSTSDFVNFTDLSYDTDGSVVNWSWDFGDGNSSFDQNPVHSYGDGRLYEVYLTVIDDDGFIDIKSGRVNVSNVAPVANFSWAPLYPTTSDFVNFTDLSYDTDGSVVYWSWDFGDGNSSFDQNPVHSYGDDGVYTVTLIVVDDDDEVDNYSDNVIISNVAPVANFSWMPIYPTTSDLVNFTDLSYDTDGSVVNWSWDFGDGNNSYTQNPSHQYENYGEYIITLKIIDNQGLNDTINKNISVLITINITLNVGWNLINIPVNNSFMASELADDINGCISINRWDNINQTYKPYIVGGPPDFDFEVSPGMGLFVETSEFNLFIVRGYPVQNVSINLEIPWNMIGWYQEYDTNASSLSENISGCQTVNMWDSVNQTYRPYIVGGPPDFDFPVNAGMGLFVEVDVASIWYGDG